MEELNHFFHEHPLLLRNEENEKGEEEEDVVLCWRCNKPIFGPSYRCRDCNYFGLHKSCAELPQQIENHPAHPQHPLDMSCWPPRRACSACYGKDGFLKYCCIPCEFYLDIGCVQIAQTIQHTSHQHPLTLLQRKANFLCDSCGVRHAEDGFIYQCSTCQFWLHEECASLPSSVKHTSHDHPLTLASAFQLDPALSMFKIYCDICGKEVKIRRNCFHCCAGCRFFAHVYCATSKIESPIGRSESSDTEAKGHSRNLLCLPMRDESSSLHLVNQLLEQLSPVGSNESGREQHCFLDHQILTLLDNTGIDEICDACILPISAPYYNCSKCHLVLHKSCADLPTEIHHPLLEKHPLSLYKGRYLKCHACNRVHNGLAFRCTTADCFFNLDIKCASLPIAIRHEAHDEHVLNLKCAGSLAIRSGSSSSRCSACCEDSKTHMFKCTTTSCNFNLHIKCALLPRTLTYGYDSHGRTLTYSPAGIVSDEYYCEICEGRVNMRLWFYYCAHCDCTFHCGCLCKAADDYANTKFGSAINVDDHPHSLVFARTAKHKRTSCNDCGGPCGKAARECKDCKFYLCFLHGLLSQQT